ALAQATGRGTTRMAEALANLNPDIVVILGDRYEMLSAATAAFMLHLPIAHIHGGEVTEGAMDESIRHAITKLSTWHFASHPAHAARLRQLGEEPGRIFTTGAPGVDNLAAPALPKAELEASIGLTLKAPSVLVTYHPETLSPQSVEAQTAALLAALVARPDITWLITGANADAGGHHINAALKQFADTHPNACFHLSLGMRRYIAALHAVSAVLGNSSSALIEAPALGRAAVNIGDRQKGRTRGENVIDCPCEAKAILTALGQALAAKPAPSALFGTPGTVCPAIAIQLLALTIPAPRQKIFSDIKQ
ncbi:MAG: UDP-N-acetylglucosamine 2-epimerase (hydrolyzing), partial [Rickettsiales bacterium]|nr:UDP-N-acetylglucosamine 2-epimerase (hydrolyzing) [Rickettsiales bacterium]